MTDVEELIDEARRNVAEMDAIDAARGSLPMSTSVALRDAMEAILTGICRDDWQCVAEALAMIENLHDRLNQDKPPYRADA